jgi:Ankyrin repeat
MTVVMMSFMSKLFFLFFFLQRFIGGRTQTEIDSLVSSKTGGCTPLLIACRNGHYDVVQYLLKRCHADVEQCGSVIFDGETIENGELDGSLWNWKHLVLILRD